LNGAPDLAVEARGVISWLPGQDARLVQDKEVILPNPIARGICLFLGLFSLLNVAGGWFSPGFDANHWWIDFRPLPPGISSILLAGSAALMLVHAIRPTVHGWRARATPAAIILLLGVCLCNIAIFYLLLARKLIGSQFALPFSLLIAAALAIILRSLLQPPRPPRRPSRPWMARLCFAASVPACAVFFPLAQMFCFGKTDYRRPADAIVVLGARAYASGEPSLPLADRVRTACALYHQGWAPLVIFSGGPGDGAIHETESMRRFAISLGVPDRAILLDPAGLNTAATVANTIPIMREHGLQRILAVSHFYHLPRIKMAYRRAGQEVFTVPADETRTMAQMPRLIAREVAALWAYYLGIAR
jgi:uncharacterized SAM-binding protein YcdF (DUF218 family)